MQNACTCELGCAYTAVLANDDIRVENFVFMKDLLHCLLRQLHTTQKHQTLNPGSNQEGNIRRSKCYSVVQIQQPEAAR